MTTSTDPTKVLVPDAVTFELSSQFRALQVAPSVVPDRRTTWSAIALLVARGLVVIAVAAAWVLIVAVLLVVGLVERVARKITGKGTRASPSCREPARLRGLTNQ